MGLLSNSASFVRYTVEGELPENFWDFVGRRIVEFAFRDIDDTFDEQSIGWVSVQNMFDNKFAYSSYAVADNIVLSLRVDERKVSTAILKKFCLKEEERIKKEREIPKLSRVQRLEIKENIKMQLLKRAAPGTAIYDLHWNLADGVLHFFSTNVKAQSILEDLFKDTFGLHIMLQIPYLTAMHLLDADGQEALTNIKPEIFV
jgi:DNA recombination-dependent growth factor C